MVRPGLVVALVLTVVAQAAHAGQLARSIGMYTGGGQALPMLDSKVDVVVRGAIVETVVTQRFENRTERATEATYIFPLPVDAAVSAMSIRVGTRTIRAAIEKREQATQRYEAAVRAGVVGALLEQERPDVFTQTVAAIPAKGAVEITLRYDTTARFSDGTWELVLPMTVAPRYVPGTATGRPTTGAGRSPDTERAPDASRVTPGGAPGAGGATAVTIHFADPVADVSSPSHDLKGKADASFVDLHSDHDAIVRWRTSAPAAGWVEQGSDGGYAAVVVEAAAAPAKKAGIKLLLVLDRAATTRGDADGVMHPIVRALAGALDASDKLAVTGSDGIGWAAPADVLRAIEQAWSRPAGAFDLTRVLEAARPLGPIVLVSDGLVADDAAVLAAAKKLGVAIHVIGVGPAPARGLLTQIAAGTGGTIRFAVPGDDLAALAKAAVLDAGTQPAPLTVNWGTLVASDVVPGVLPRLGAGQAIIVLARVKRAEPANARARGELFSIETLPPARVLDGVTTTAGPLARRWARTKLDELTGAAAITAHALRYGLVSRETSLVAIGTDVVVQGGVKHSVAVPVSVPAGMPWDAVKQQTTVDATTLSGRDGPTVETKTTKHNDAWKAGAPVTKEPPRAPGAAKKPDAKKTEPRPDPRPPKTEPRPEPSPEPAKPTLPTGRHPIAAGPSASKAPAAPPADEAPARTTADHRSKDDGEANGDADGVPDAVDLDARPGRFAHETVATGAAPQAIEEDAEMAVTSSSRRRAYRLSAALGGGVLVQDRARGVVALGARIELGQRTLTGVEGGLWLVSGSRLEGRVLFTLARRGIARFLELGGGLGLHLGDGVGPAASVSLRVHVPRTHAATYLRYDGALLVRDPVREGQNTLTLGVEYGF